MKSFMVEVSARHVHLNRQAVEVLFGKGYNLKVKKNLSQPGQYVCEEKVEVIGEKSSLKRVSVLGPEREDVQIEISKTDSRAIGIDAPVRESGDLNGSAGCVLVGPCGKLKLEKGVIIAKRHIHMIPEDADAMGVKNGDIVFVDIPSKERSLIFKDVVVRVSKNYSLAMHIDTDEANSCLVSSDVKGEIVKCN